MSHRARIIPVLLLSERGLVKSIAFGAHRYIGDHLNAARIFSELGADELFVLDIDAGNHSRAIAPDIVRGIADEVSMPLTAGGGISRIDQVSEIIAAGAEKVVLCTGAWKDPYLIKEAAERHGTSAICICIDVKTGPAGKRAVHVKNGTYDTGLSPVEFARLVEDHGAGEIVIQSIDRDGKMSGYDVSLVADVANAVNIPVVALGGAGTAADLKGVIRAGSASAAAAGSMFVYSGPLRGVLLSYLSREDVLC
jgi:cyclase